jgi:hypothetical protein
VLSQIKPQAPACSKQIEYQSASHRLSAEFIQLPPVSHLSVGADYILGSCIAQTHCHLVCELRPLANEVFAVRTWLPIIPVLCSFTTPLAVNQGAMPIFQSVGGGRDFAGFPGNLTVLPIDD